MFKSIDHLYINYYILYFGIIITFTGILELFMPIVIYKFWKKWINHKLFFFHGLMYIFIGFPLILYNNKFSNFIFIVGLIIIFSGPFILIYPEKIRKFFFSYFNDLKAEEMNKIIYADGIVRIIVGFVFIYSYI